MNKGRKIKKLKLAVIVGGTGGIGAATAQLFLEQGYGLAILYHHDKNQAQAIIDQSAGRAMAYQCTINDENSVQRVFNNILKQQGVIDIVVFAPSAPVTPRPVAFLSWDNFSRHLDIQAKGLFLVVKNLNGQIRAKQGIKFIILLTEFCLGAPPLALADYVTAKYALLGLAKCLAVELGRFNCTVNMISPGLVETKLLTGLPASFVEAAKFKNPLQKLAQPQDIAQVILFLASDKANYLNGANITVNGGTVML